MPDIFHSVTLPASPERVYAALTTAEGIRQWWTHDAALDSEIGGTGEFGFFDHQVVTKIRVDELMPPFRVGWKTLSSNAPGGWVGTTITFALHPEGSGTALTLAHRGFAEANEGYARVNAGWGYFLASLTLYLETGTGTPR